jgi:CRISPR-associated protein Cas5d
MEYFNKTFCLEVQGDFACFTRPEMKVERVSYDVITPSAARGIFEAIFWKPAVRWQVAKIEVLKPIRWTSVRRNEVGAVANTSSSGIYIEPTRQQRASLILRDVAYRLHAELQFIAPRDRGKTPNPVPEWLQDPEEMTALRTGPDENPGKYNAMFERRARKGQCFNQPYLGTREFSCAFRFVDNSESEEPPIDETRELGFMLYDMMFPKQGDVNQEIQSAFFRARLEKGVVVVPRWESEEVRR